jgi:cytoskeleton protein RodZ
VTDDAHPTGPGDVPSPSDPVADGPTPGAVLAASRQHAGLSVEDVAAATRIRSSLVRAIERDDYERCGGEVYARGHIRAIAHLVGADADGLVADFTRRYGQHPPKLTVAPVSTLSEPVREVTRKATRAAPRWPSFAIGVLAVIVVLLVVSWVIGRGDNPNTPAQAGSAVSPTVEPSSTVPTSTAPPTLPPTRSTPALPPGVTVLVAVIDESSWVRVVSAQGAELFQGTLVKGETRRFHDATALSLRLGNSPVVELTVNGTRIGRPCEASVCSVTYPIDHTSAG